MEWRDMWWLKTRSRDMKSGVTTIGDIIGVATKDLVESLPACTNLRRQLDVLGG